MSTVQVEIKGKDNLSPAIHKSKTALDSLKGSAHSLINAFNPMAIAGAGVALAIGKISSTVTKLVTEFGESERTAIQLQTALGGSSDAFSRMSDLIDEMATKTVGSKDELEALVGQMASLGKSEADIQKITDATVTLSNVTGMGLDAAFKAINGTYVGTTKELKKLIPEIGDLSKEQLAAGSAVDILNEKLGAISDAMAGGITQKVKNLKDSFGDLRENIGEQMLTAFSPMLELIQSVVTKWNDAYEAHRKYQDAVSGGDSELAAALKSLDTAKKALAKEQQRRNAADADASGILQKDEGLWRQLNSQLLTAQRMYDNLAASRRGAIGSPAQSSQTPAAGSTVAAATGSSSTPIQVVAIDGFNSDAYRQALAEQAALFADIGSGTNEYGANPISSGSGSGGFDLFGGDSMNPLALLGDLFKDIAGPLASVTALMNPMGEILKGVMDIIGPLIDTLLTPLVGILRIVGQTIGKLLIPVFELLGPVITFISKLFVFQYNKIWVPIFNGIMTVFNLLYNGFASFINLMIALINKIPGVKIKKIKYRDMEAGYLDEISLEDVSNAGTGTVSGTGGTSGSSASYSQARDITVNVSLTTSALVGEDGFRQFALIIGRELQSAGVLGMA